MSALEGWRNLVCDPMTAPLLERLRFVMLATIVACGSSQSTKEAPIARGPHNVDVELPQFEINGDGVDRFATCPPTGGVTQGWIPNVGTWAASEAPAVATNADAGAAAAPGALPRRTDDEIAAAPRAGEPSNAPTAAEKAIRDTLQPFRTCHRRGLLHDATQDGHVAIVIRVGADGRVAKTESHGACELSREVIACMMHVANRLRFDPPAEGTPTTIILPAVFAPRSGIVRNAPGSHDEYAAAASVSLETARRGLHDCEQRERRAVRSQQAWATFIMDVDDKGRVVRQNLDPWSGNQELLKCAGDVMSRVTFPPPVSGTATVRARISFNPRGILAGE